MGEGHNSTVRSRCHLGAPMPRNAFILPSSIFETRGWHEAGTRGAPENHPRVDGFPERQATTQRAARSFREECDGTNPVQPRSVSADYPVTAVIILGSY